MLEGTVQAPVFHGFARVAEIFGIQGLMLFPQGTADAGEYLVRDAGIPGVTAGAVEEIHLRKEPHTGLFGEGFEKKMLVDFGYLLTIFMALGDDILFGMQHVKNVDTPNLLFRSKDGSIEGVLMPLRVVDDSDLKGKHEIVMVRT